MSFDYLDELDAMAEQGLKPARRKLERLDLEEAYFAASREASAHDFDARLAVDPVRAAVLQNMARAARTRASAALRRLEAMA